MSGAIALASLAVAAGSLWYGIYSGEKAQGAQKAALAQQNKTQQQAQANALSTERQSAVAQSAANQQKPNIAAILARAATMGNNGLSSTMLTGPAGVNANQLNLGKSTLLGS